MPWGCFPQPQGEQAQPRDAVEQRGTQGLNAIALILHPEFQLIFIPSDSGSSPLYIRMIPTSHPTVGGKMFLCKTALARAWQPRLSDGTNHHLLALLKLWVNGRSLTYSAQRALDRFSFHFGEKKQQKECSFICNIPFLGHPVGHERS